MIDLLIVRRFGRRHTACVMPLPARRHKISTPTSLKSVFHTTGITTTAAPYDRVFCIYFMCRPGTDDKHFDLNFDTV
jgi:hypothetical protein